MLPSGRTHPELSLLHTVHVGRAVHRPGAAALQSAERHPTRLLLAGRFSLLLALRVVQPKRLTASPPITSHLDRSRLNTTIHSSNRLRGDHEAQGQRDGA